ncbi:isochorismate synthase MenF [Oceanobacillus sp. FSL H7-0719]|uniref:isochorismate synthase n=1 Tax=Oceanobacillus sp. FSL H7-0719 TaxID=2954507 RepID=UPI0032442148
MIDINMEMLEARLKQAIDSINPNEKFKLISITKQIDKNNPLQIFEGAETLHKDRFYWTSADRNLTFTGVGKLHVLEANEDRFAHTEEQWKALLKKATIDNPYESIPGTGIVAFGGMSFDPLEETTALWKKFQQSQFYIPELMFTEYKETHYLTINVLASKTDDAEELADHLEAAGKSFLNGEAFSGQDLQIEKEIEIDPVTWKQSVRQATEEITEGKAEKIVLAREIRLHFDQQANIASVIKNLIKTQQTSYIFAFESDGDCFIGATPERLVKVEKSNLLSTCLAGTAPRGQTAEEDRKIGKQLLTDEKNRQEHEFVVKMIKKALLKSCKHVEIPKEPVLLRLENLQHLYTPVTGQLMGDYTIFNVVEELHPTPALGGTPTKESLAFIREHELLDRGWYGAPIGWVDSNNNGEFAVAIRSGLIQGDEASLFAGCGVVADSEPEMEYEETKIKLLPMRNVLGGHSE